MFKNIVTAFVLLPERETETPSSAFLTTSLNSVAPKCFACVWAFVQKMSPLLSQNCPAHIKKKKKKGPNLSAERRNNKKTSGVHGCGATDLSGRGSVFWRGCKRCCWSSFLSVSALARSGVSRSLTCARLCG